MNGLVVTTDERMFVRDFEMPLHESVQEVLDGFFEIVHPRRLPPPYCFLCNDEGLIRDLPINLFGSVLYDTFNHGYPIVGNIVLFKTGMTDDGEDIVGLDSGDIEMLKEMAIDVSWGRIRDLDEEEDGDA